MSLTGRIFAYLLLAAVLILILAYWHVLVWMAAGVVAVVVVAMIVDVKLTRARLAGRSADPAPTPTPIDGRRFDYKPPVGRRKRRSP